MTAELGPDNAFWDGEWISWDEIDEQIQHKDWRARFPNGDLSIAQGSDGRIGNDLVEVKTITPFKSNDRVTLNLARNLGTVLIVKINADFEIAARMIDRKAPPRVKGSRLMLDWNDLERPYRSAVDGCLTGRRCHRLIKSLRNLYGWAMSERDSESPSRATIADGEFPR